LFQRRVSKSWVSDNNFNLRQGRNKFQNKDFLDKFIEKSENEIEKRK